MYGKGHSEMPTHGNVQLIIVNSVIHVISISCEENWHMAKPESTWGELRIHLDYCGKVDKEF